MQLICGQQPHAPIELALESGGDGTSVDVVMKQNGRTVNAPYLAKFFVGDEGKIEIARHRLPNEDFVRRGKNNKVYLSPTEPSVDW